MKQENTKSLWEVPQMNLLSLHFAMKELDWWSCFRSGFQRMLQRERERENRHIEGGGGAT